MKTEGPTDLKRDNWTNEEVLAILASYKQAPRSEEEAAMLEKHADIVSQRERTWDEALEELEELFRQFQIPAQQFGAFAYSPAQDQVWGIWGNPRGRVTPKTSRA